VSLRPGGLPIPSIGIRTVSIPLRGCVSLRLALTLVAIALLLVSIPLRGCVSLRRTMNSSVPGYRPICFNPLTRMCVFETDAGFNATAEALRFQSPYEDVCL